MHKTKPEFKVGDRVRCVSPPKGCSRWQNQVVIVEDINRQGALLVLFPGEMYLIPVDPARFVHENHKTVAGTA